ncbi:MAG: hypothetical protein AAF657_05735 [Acidobacteriota bacterium]
MLTAATWLVNILTIYLGVGLLFAIAFVWKGVGKIDPAAKEGTIGFRLLIIPGAAALWPILANRWMRGEGPPTERNPHRCAALEGQR